MGIIVLILLIIIGIIIYMVATKDERAEKREQFRLAREQEKHSMLTNPSMKLIIDGVVETLTDLKGGCVQLLRSNSDFYVVFNIYGADIEVRWREKVGDNYKDQKRVKNILNFSGLGKNPLKSEAEVGLFEEIIFDKLNAIEWLDVYKNYKELHIRKAKNKDIPEAFCS